MSSAAAWANTNIATVWPFLSIDRVGGAVVYGEPYQIACTWAIGRGRRERLRVGAGASIDAAGQEFVVTATFYTEDKRPKYRDMIAKYAHAGTWQEAQAVQIRNVHEDDASMFDEPDRPDFELLV